MTGRFNQAIGQESLPPLHVDLVELDDILGKHKTRDEHLKSFCDTLSVPVHRFTYEHLLTDRSAVLSQIFELLGVPSDSVSSALQKATNDDLREALENFDEVRTHYLGTEYEPMLGG